MEKVINFLNNKWLRLGVSVLSLIYPVFLAFVGWIVTGYFLEPTHEGALFTLYIFINVIFGGIMLFTRKQIITKMCAMITPLVAFAILLLGFGNWFIIVPPVVVSVLIFFLCSAGETTKIVLGTIYLIMYVVGVLVYLTFQMLFGNISLMDVDLSTRSTTYNYSPDKQYRIVTYVEPEKDERRTVSFYLEKTDGDIELPFLTCRKVIGSIHLITSDYSKPAKLEWKQENTLYIDGRKREYNFDVTDDDIDDITSSKATTSKDNSSTVSGVDNDSASDAESSAETDDTDNTDETNE